MATRISDFSLLSVVLLGLFTGNCMAYGRSESESTGLLSKMINLNKFAQYNSYISRMRRSTQSTVRSVTPGTQFRVGNCALETFLQMAKNCSHEFYNSVRRKDASRGQCGQKYKTMRTCMSNTLTGCIHGSIIAGSLNQADRAEIRKNFLVFLGNEEFWCDKGGLGISSDYLPVGAVCDPVFHQVSEGCTAAYSRLFNSSAPEERLCTEYQKAKKCFLQTVFQHCSFSRMLLQMLEIMVEITADFQPFCAESAQQEVVKFEELFTERTCPPHSLADVAFLFDVTNGTTRRQFISMKRIVQDLSKRMNYGWNGLHISVSHFDLQLRSLIKFGRATTKAGIQKRIRTMRRTATMSRNKRKRMTGRSLATLARQTFSKNKDEEGLMKKPSKSGQRPHNTAVAFVFTTGTSSDSMLAALETLKDRNVHIVFAGPKTVKIPSPSNTLLSGESYPFIKTEFNFGQVKDVGSQVAREICDADRQRHWKDRSALAEGQQSNSTWRVVQTLINRLGSYDLSLLFELRPIVPIGQAPTLKPTSGITEGWGGTSRNPFQQGPTLVEGDEFGMDGDNIPSRLGGDKPSPTIQDLMEWPFFYISENEYPQEYSYPA